MIQLEHMVVIDKKLEADLMALPVDRTMGFQISDRHFTIVDSEFFYDICRNAGFLITDGTDERGESNET